METLQESLLILQRNSREIWLRTNLMIENEYHKIDAHEIGPQLTLFLSLFYMTIIESCSYLDEFENVFGVKSEKKYQKRILIVKRSTKPFIKKIKEWNDLREFRNSIVAHNLRKKDGKMALTKENLDYNTPRTMFDLVLLSNCITLTQNIINSEFNNELNEAVGSMQDTLHYDFKIGFSKEEVSQITLELIKDVNKLIPLQGRNYLIRNLRLSNWNKL
jgi:hypothetical protein